MKRRKQKKRRTLAELKAAVLKNNLMKRFIRDVEREEPLDEGALKTLLVYQPVRLKY